ncbi:hypothetical protein AB870_00775 [Pandoraea faecigallinarum]|uniref:Uncharacterized protein n=1 Tax=Pandoraea faecigallinarum TaxID=656179 RepID=A0A0H3WMN7_9BURK|nr:NirD/YgiW/YdeI family stress tolerance protein [Pandoraea faecigallinarum]AKM28977.1 hypothetical protein AB870_00775 [Pandoraea faecigallinarum]
MSKKSERRLTLALAGSLIAAGVMLSAPAQAQINVPQAGAGGATGGGVVAPAVMPRAVTVEQALAAKHDLEAVIEGHIVQKESKHEHYTFRDAAGKTIVVDIDDKYIPTGREITPDTLVRIWGEVDVHRLKPNDIEVKKIEFVDRK